MTQNDKSAKIKRALAASGQRAAAPRAPCATLRPSAAYDTHAQPLP